MTHNNQKKAEDKSGVGGMAAAVVTGAVIGAGAVVAGAVAMSDEKNREKAKEVLSDAKDQAVGYVEDKKKEVEEKLAEGEEVVKKVVEAAEDTLEEEADDMK